MDMHKIPGNGKTIHITRLRKANHRKEGFYEEQETE